MQSDQENKKHTDLEQYKEQGAIKDVTTEEMEDYSEETNNIQQFKRLD